MPTLAVLEIQALARIIDELDYYQMLHLERDASSREVRQAYYATSRVFHPDANRHLAPDVFANCSTIAKRVTEGYCVLRDPRKRRAYDDKLADNIGFRIQLAEARAAEKSGHDEARMGKTDQGRRFHQKATAAIVRSDWATARNNLQMALTFEPKNESFKKSLEEVQAKLETERKAGISG